MKTKIAFQFIKPMGFSIEGYGNFYPKLTKKAMSMPNVVGNFWVDDYDFDETFTLDIMDETARDLPEHIKKNEDATVRAAYHVKQAEIAAINHDKNNGIRDFLQDMAERGYIKVTSDSFMDERPEVIAPPKRKPGRPKKIQTP